jgi:hypothetical protein
MIELISDIMVGLGLMGVAIALSMMLGVGEFK